MFDTDFKTNQRIMFATNESLHYVHDIFKGYLVDSRGDHNDRVVVEDDASRKTHIIPTDQIARQTMYAGIGIKNGKLMLGDTKDNERYAENSFKKHHPDASFIYVIEV